ncbi:alpha/beta hydrolase [archaeon]|nr:MAG: alpha/beta hydrolase [archaeon]
MRLPPARLLAASSMPRASSVLAALAAGPPAHVVLLPGLLCTPRLFAAVQRRIGSACDVIIPTTHTGSAASMEGMVSDMLAHLPARFAVAGFSMGGYAALEMVRQAPHRISGIACLSTQARADSEQTRARRAQHVAEAQRTGSLHHVLTDMLPKLLAPRQLPAGWEAYLTPATCPPHLFDTHAAFTTCVRMAHDVAPDGFALQQQRIMSRHDTRDALRKYATEAARAAAAAATTALPHEAHRILLLHGGADTLIPLASHSEMYKIAHHVSHHAPHAVPAPSDDSLLRVVLPGVGHMSALEAGDAVADAVARWLRLPGAVE